MKGNYKNQKGFAHRSMTEGFTLIELLVVVSIIALLSGIIFASIDVARSKARDAVRYSDMKQIKNSIELYFADNGIYPTCNGEELCDSYPTFEPINNLLVVPTYIREIKGDPTNGLGNGGYIYAYAYARGYRKTGDNTYVFTGEPTDYIIGMRLENSQASDYSAWGYNFNYLDGN